MSHASSMESGSREMADGYELQADPTYLNFRSIEETAFDESKPWKPATEVKVELADGSVQEGVDANLPVFTFKDADGNELTVSASAAGHVDRLHIKGEDLGSKFDEPSLQALFQDAAQKMPAGIGKAEGTSAFSVDMGKNMGREGIASMAELTASGDLVAGDVAAATATEPEVAEFNLSGDKVAKEAFIAKFKQDHADCKVQFQLVRGDVLVPTVDIPKRPTNELFMVFGPDDEGTKKTLYTVVPGRNMPKHPNPKQHMDAQGKVNPETFKASAKAWFETVMLTGK